MLEKLEPGEYLENIFVVEEDHTAAHIGSGALRVLATPWMVAYMERTARQLAAQYLSTGYSSVGAQVSIRHLAPSVVGAQVRVVAELLEKDGRKLRFRVGAWDGERKIGEGEHLRVVIDEARFIAQLEGKDAP